MLGIYLNLHRDSRRMPGMLGDRVSSVCLLSLVRRRLIGSDLVSYKMAPFHPADVCGNLVGKPRKLSTQAHHRVHKWHSTFPLLVF